MRHFSDQVILLVLLVRRAMMLGCGEVRQEGAGRICSCRCLSICFNSPGRDFRMFIPLLPLRRSL